MRYVKLTIGVGVLCLLASPVLADWKHGSGYSGGVADYTRNGGYYDGSGGEFTLHDYGSPAGSLLSNSAYAATTRGVGDKSESFQTFCVETAEIIHDSMQIWVSTRFINSSPGSHAWEGGFEDTGDDLDFRTAYLYTKFATGTLKGTVGGYTFGSDYNYTPGALREASALALQRAIWYIEEEDGGQYNYWVTLATDAVNDDGIIDYTDEWVGMGIGNVRVLQTGYGAGIPWQDQLYLIPAPGAALLGVIGLGAIVWIRRRLT